MQKTPELTLGLLIRMSVELGSLEQLSLDILQLGVVLQLQLINQSPELTLRSHILLLLDRLLHETVLHLVVSSVHVANLLIVVEDNRSQFLLTLVYYGPQ